MCLFFIFLFFGFFLGLFKLQAAFRPLSRVSPRVLLRGPRIFSRWSCARQKITDALTERRTPSVRSKQSDREDWRRRARPVTRRERGRRRRGSCIFFFFFVRALGRPATFRCARPGHLPSLPGTELLFCLLARAFSCERGASLCVGGVHLLYECVPYIHRLKRIIKKGNKKCRRVVEGIGDTR